METAKVYSRLPFEPIAAKDSWLFDAEGNKYLDFYGGHAVISVGHSHPYYVRKLQEQIAEIAFYSNSLIISGQEKLAEKLGQISGYEDYSLFLCNSGAEANENALKIASMANGKSKILAFKDAFHGRTALTYSCTDLQKGKSALNEIQHVVIADKDLIQIENMLKSKEFSSVIFEGIQGYAGINEWENDFLFQLQKLCHRYKVIMIADEIQSGYGRTGKFFAHQHYNVRPDLITIAKGMGNGFPIAGVLIHPEFQLESGSLGTTFGGNHLAVTAGLSVLEIIQNESLMYHAKIMGDYLRIKLEQLKLPAKIKGKGLMTGLEFPFEAGPLKNELFKRKVLVGDAKNKQVLRLLPSLTIQMHEIDFFIEQLHIVTEKLKKHEAVL